jgi:probable F420-dependent oxidoreductase
MEIGLFPFFTGPDVGPDLIAALGAEADRLGIASIWSPEAHVVTFDDYDSPYPYSLDQKMPGAPIGKGDYASFLVLAHLAATTTRVRLGTGVCILPQRNPLYASKEIITLDYLSSGRVDFGIGIGWLKEEFDAVGADWETRALRTREYVDLMLCLWRDELVTYNGRFVQLRESRQDPKPLQKPHPPIYFGGNTDAALRRVADLGNGWYGFNRPPEDISERVDVLRDLLGARGRASEGVKIVVGLGRTGGGFDSAGYAQAGAQQLVVPLPLTTREQLVEDLQAIVESVRV